VDLPTRTQLRAGDRAAFGLLFDAFASAVHRYATRWTGDPSAAEDVVSLTFLEAWRLHEKLRPEGDSVLPWLLGIATNVLRNRQRAARRHRAALLRVPLRDTVPDFADEVVGRLHDSEQLAAAAVALRRLRRADREVFLLCVWSQLDYAATAEALAIPVGTVRSRLSRARVRLRSLAEAELSRREAGDPDREKAEPLPRRGQVQGDRTAQEEYR
jgi:RNA polymerase sigma-70 factor (ECF subfamily)